MEGRSAGRARGDRTADKTTVEILGAVLAVAAEDDRYRAVRERAAELALSDRP